MSTQSANEYPYTIGARGDLARGFAIYHHQTREGAIQHFADLGPLARDWALGEINAAFDPRKTTSPENPVLVLMENLQ